MAKEQDQKTKEKLFRVTPEEDGHVISWIQYAHKVGFIAKVSPQDFMQFAIQCTGSVFKQDWDDTKSVLHRR